MSIKLIDIIREYERRLQYYHSSRAKRGDKDFITQEMVAKTGAIMATLKLKYFAGEEEITQEQLIELEKSNKPQ